MLQGSTYLTSAKHHGLAALLPGPVPGTQDRSDTDVRSVGQRFPDFQASQALVLWDTLSFWPQIDMRAMALQVMESSALRPLSKKCQSGHILLCFHRNMHILEIYENDED